MGRSRASQKIRLIFCGLSSLLFSLSASAVTYTESFNSTSAKGAVSTLIWNQALGELHPPLWVTGWVDEGVGGNTAIDFGDGRHGSFELSTYSQFGTVNGNIIEINTDHYPDGLQVTSFTLEANYVIRPIGSRPFVVRSLSDITVNGYINCSGEDGEAGDNTLTVKRGGRGHCGGGDGGDSGAAGTSGGLGVTGGGAGADVSNTFGGIGGGGGGGFVRDYSSGGSNPDNTDGVNPSGGAGGVAGSRNRDDSFSEDENGAGSGGGGGGRFVDSSDPSIFGSGGGGGAGGGNIRLYAVRNVVVGAGGIIRANGGAGGNATVGGAGGGGSGGSILIFAGDSIANGGIIRAMPGLGGEALNGGDGGAGSVGRTWLVAKDAASLTGNLEVPWTELDVPGDVRYRLGTFLVESNVVDVGNTRPTLTATNSTVVGTGNALIEMSVSADGSISSFGNFDDINNFVGQTFSRFFRFRISLTNNDPLDPVRVQDFAIDYEGNTQKEFDFKGACGSIGAGLSAGRGNGLYGAGPLSLAAALMFLLPFLTLLGLRLRT